MPATMPLKLSPLPARSQGVARSLLPLPLVLPNPWQTSGRRARPCACLAVCALPERARVSARVADIPHTVAHLLIIQKPCYTGRSHSSQVDEIERAIIHCTVYWNDNRHPYHWRKAA